MSGRSLLLASVLTAGLMSPAGAADRVYELTVPGDVVLVGGLNDEFAGCLRCALPGYELNPFRYHSPYTCAVEYDWLMHPFPESANPFSGAYASTQYRYSPWNPNGDGLLVLERTEDGWTYLGVLSVNPGADRSWHPLARTVLEAYETSGSITQTLVALCEAVPSSDF